MRRPAISTKPGTEREREGASEGSPQPVPAPAMVLASWLLAAAVGLFLPAPPPPPPSPPGVGCSGERIFSTSTGSLSVSFGGAGTPLRCSFLLHTSAPGVTLSFGSLSLVGASDTCVPSAAHIRVYDGSTAFNNMLASYTCQNHWRVGSTGGNMLLVFTADADHTGSFSLSWGPSANSCGNGVCEPSADEYDTCLNDCHPTQRAGPLPDLELQHDDRKCATLARVPPPAQPARPASARLRRPL